MSKGPECLSAESTGCIIDVASQKNDETNHARALWLATHAGAIALQGSFEGIPPIESKPKNLYEALPAAAQGDEKALEFVRINVHTDTFERTIKAGFVLSVPLEVLDGRILQNGQTNEQIQANTLHYLGSATNMLPRFMAETRNMYRLEAALNDGLLDEYNFVVFSRCPDDMSDKELGDAGFFVPTKSMAVQSTSAQNGHIETESAFVAGVTRPNEPRHDRAMVAGFGEQMGVELDKDATHLLDTPILIHKSLMPNGVVDIVRILDEVNGGTFFGELNVVQDYAKFREQCRQRELEMKPLVDTIVAEMIRNIDKIHDPLQAVALLNKLSAQYTLQHSLTDHRIDSRVFGEQSAWHIEFARAQAEVGNINQVKLAMRAALRLETSSSCASGGNKPDKEFEMLEDQTSDKKTEEIEDCEFVSKQCPKCGAKNVKTTCISGKFYGECGCHS